MNAVDQQGRLVKARSSLPSAGPLSELIGALLSAPPDSASLTPAELAETVATLLERVKDPIGDDDLQLALYLCYELHYRSFAGIHPAWEWDPALLAARAQLETAFFGCLDEKLAGQPIEPEDVGDIIFRLEAEEQWAALSRHLQNGAEREEFRELLVHRSFYRLKEPDPHSWAIPRLSGPPQAALTKMLGEEYGAGHSERMHARLFAGTMRALDLDDGENAYVGHAPGISLATVNLISGLGLHRSRRGAVVGHLAMLRLASAQISRRYSEGLRRLGFDLGATDVYDEHVEDGASHENFAAYELAGGLARQEPKLAADIVFGARALLYLEDRFARRLLTAWENGETSLRKRL
ncbi:MAG TPA: iron-containing redox enzyme family protein [Solirubrobacterales bacterium]|nr:iron-containing redox enzyme family protein [Solirubrobacterales bacterium]